MKIKKKSKSNQNFGSFLANLRFRAKGKKVTSRAELKIIQLELWLEPARLGLITNILDIVSIWHFLSTSNKGIWLKKKKMNAGVKKCHFGTFSEWAGMAVPC